MSFDAAGPALFDTLVISDPDAPRALADLAEESVPHVLITTGDGLRHKLTPDRAEAACGAEYHAGFDQFVPPSLDGDLCTECFTQHELDRAARARSKRAQDASDLPPLRLVDARNPKRTR